MEESAARNTEFEGLESAGLCVWRQLNNLSLCTEHTFEEGRKGTKLDYTRNPWSAECMMHNGTFLKIVTLI